MTPEERQMLGGLFQRVNATAQTQRDVEAEAFINDAVRTSPHAPYVLSQTVLVQQQALEAAANRISQLEAVAQQGAEQGQEHGSFLGNLGKTIFGGGAPVAPPRPSYDASAYQRGPAPAPGPAYAPPPPPQGYPPQPQAYPPQPGPWGAPPQPAGGGFLKNAASTAAGVAGGVALGNLLGGLFGGHAGGGGLFGGGGVGGAGLFGVGVPGGGNETVNIFEEAPDRGAADQFDRGAPGVQDANFDQPDDATFDSSDDSSYDGDGGGGYDDV